MLNIRRANENEAETLTNIAIRSEAYWGYDAEFMERFKTIYKITEELINNQPTFVLERDEDIVGFYSLLIKKNEASLEYFYIEPQFIGKGYGKSLWNLMVESCRYFGIKAVEIVTSPQAKEFYMKLGAVQTGEIESLVREGRKIPRLIYILE